MLRHFFVILAFVSLTSCSHSPVNPPEQTLVDDLPSMSEVLRLSGVSSVDFFSTFMVEASTQQCQQPTVTCSDDPIPATVWYDILQPAFAPVPLSKSVNTSDYELLVASQLREKPLQSSESKKSRTAMSHSIHTEFTLQWRGFALNTYQTSTAYDSEQSLPETAIKLVKRWQNHASVMGIFSRDFLYTSLKASDYRNELVLPSTLGDLYLEDTQLYADPFLGVVARYRHPSFENAILDINVSPILAPLNQVDINWMHQQISQDFSRAEQVSSNHDMTFEVDETISEIVLSNTNGHYFSVHAVDAFDEPLYAATYLFKRHDKLVKFTSSFPHSIATPLVAEALTTLKVPTESQLMLQMRALL